jgi:hypothetical protein
VTGPESELDSAVERDLLAVAHGDPATAKTLRQSLDRMTTGAVGEELGEMAREILAGRITLREAVLSSDYGAHVHNGFERFLDYYRQLDTEQQGELRDSGRAHLQRLTDEDR